MLFLELDLKALVSLISAMIIANVISIEVIKQISRFYFVIYLSYKWKTIAGNLQY